MCASHQEGKKARQTGKHLRALFEFLCSLPLFASLVFLFVLDTGSCWPGWPDTHYVAQAVLNLVAILLSQLL